ncbi:hypothetical protein AGRA3207_003143 [Actinomadura graeca]|uniref:Tetratricopeptide repeat protein n=1 Tax=Actinomadura graeca TaxID=2750812 RepID=A0ABX8QXK2_9ACTN|nr:hypothetical protein [Actinomadura graeca]QXJ22182.1 hypothetical protein AGRA3207_003143 [Actinomadura graeca]
MTTPEPDDTPFAVHHEELVADLADGLHIGEGLARILPVGATGVGAEEATAAPHRGAHADLIADLRTALPLPEGLANILHTERGHGDLVAGLEAALDTERGLSDILTPGPKGDTRPPTEAVPDTQAESAATQESRSADDALARIHTAPAHHRLMLRLGHPHRYLRSARKDLRDVREYLAALPTEPQGPGFGTGVVAAVLDLQRRSMARATVLLADALAPAPPPPLAQAAQDERVLYTELLTAAATTDQPLSGKEVDNLLGVHPKEPESAPHANAYAYSLTRSAWRCEQMGSLKIAERLYREAAKAGDRNALYLLAGVREELGDQAEAERLYRQASDFKEVNTVWAYLAQTQAQTVAFQRGAEMLQQTAAIANSAAMRQEGEALTGPDPVMSGEVVRLLRRCADEMAALRERLLDGTDVPAPAERPQCLDLADDLAATMERAWQVLSDFKGADLRSADPRIQLEDLDGVTWSDEAAVSGATRWPAVLRGPVAEHSFPEDHAQAGVFVIRFGAAVSAGC